MWRVRRRVAPSRRHSECRGPHRSRSVPSPSVLELGWYCPSEGDGRLLGTRAPEREPSFEYLLRVTRAAERAGASEILVPTGVLNDSFAPDAPFMESWTTAAALAARTSRIRLIVALNPAGVL